jgi:hypothetical protein
VSLVSKQKLFEWQGLTYVSESQEVNYSSQWGGAGGEQVEFYSLATLPRASACRTPRLKSEEIGSTEKEMMSKHKARIYMLAYAQRP